MRVKCLAQEHNTMSQARVRTSTEASVNLEASVLTMRPNLVEERRKKFNLKKITRILFLRDISCTGALHSPVESNE